MDAHFYLLYFILFNEELESQKKTKKEDKKGHPLFPVENLWVSCSFLPVLSYSSLERVIQHMHSIGFNETRNFQVNVPSAPDLKSNIDFERKAGRHPSVSQSQISISERRTTYKKQIQVLDSPELYIKIKDWLRNPIVLPFYLDGRKHFKISPETPLLNHDCKLEILGDKQDQQNGWSEAVKRVSNIFTHGFKNVCKVTQLRNRTCEADGHCHHFVNYLAFGMDKQEDINFSGWYENLSFASLLEFDEKDLKWGDIVQLLAQGELKHSLFYLGNGKYINKHGGGEIYFQDLRCAQKKYPSDSVRIIRLSQDYYSSENVFKRSCQKEGCPFYSS